MVAQLTHEAVCEASGGDGAMRCLWYSAIGACLARRAFRRDYYVQAGDLLLRHDPDDPELQFMMLGSLRQGPSTGEFHSWVAAPLDSRRFEVVDLSSRAYPQLVEGALAVRAQSVAGDQVATLVKPSELRWRRPAPPPYLWLTVEGGRWPLDWVMLRMDPWCCDKVQKPAADLLIEHRHTVKKYFDRLEEALRLGREYA